MKALYFECFSGISGNMTLGALLDLGIVSKEYFIEELNKLHVDGYKIEIRPDSKNAIGATHVDVILDHPEHPDHPHDHEHEHHHEDRELTHEEMHILNLPHDGDKHYHLSDLTHEQIHQLGIPHDHEHEHEHHHEDRELTHEEMHILNLPHDGDKHYHLSDLTHEQIHQLGVPHHHGPHQRNLYDVEKIIDDSEISQGAKDLAKRIFMRVAKAESKVHQETLENVHFHEVGAVDSIVDIIGTAILIDAIRPDVIYSSVVRDGYGYIHCAHGMIPVPVPATSEIFAARGATLQQIDIDTELVTPTGAAIISELAESFGLMPTMKVEKLGWGSGSKNLKIPNVLRVSYGEIVQKKTDFVNVLETNIDDSTGEQLGFLLEMLMEHGANDAFYTPIQMKKNRPAQKLTVICNPDHVDELENIIFTHSTTIGIRKREENRTILPRKKDMIDTKYGPLEVKKVEIDGVERVYVEYESAKKLALENNLSLREIYQLVK